MISPLSSNLRPNNFNAYFTLIPEGNTFIGVAPNTSTVCLLTETKPLTDFFKEGDIETIYRNKQALDINYIPTTLEFRDQEIKEIARHIKNASMNLNIGGIIGCGKSVCLRYVLNEYNKAMKETEASSRAVYLDCKKYKTTSLILSSILSHLGINVPSKGWSISQYLELLIDETSVRDNLIVALDEVQIPASKGHDDIIRFISEMSGTILITVSNQNRWYDVLDPATMSRFMPIQMQLNPYSFEELYGILDSRARIALKDGVIEYNIEGGERSEALHKIAHNCSQGEGNARKGITWLRVLARMAEETEEKKITSDMWSVAKQQVEREHDVQIISKMTKRHKMVFLAICEAIEEGVGRGSLITLDGLPAIKIGDCWRKHSVLVNRYCVDPLKERQLREYISELETYNLILRSVSYEKNRRGKISEISLNYVDPTEYAEITRNLLDEEYEG